MRQYPSIAIRRLTAGGRSVALLLGLFAAAALLLPHPVHAATAFEHLFRTGTLDKTKTGDAFTYKQFRNNPGQQQPDPLAGKVDLVLDMIGDNEVSMTAYKDKQSRVLSIFPRDTGNPIHMYFLETLIRDMARSTGGSQYYIRNRLKAALNAATDTAEKCPSLAGDCIVITPFINDEARESMREFAFLELSFSMDDASPVWFDGLVARIPGRDDAYSFRLELQ